VEALLGVRMPRRPLFSHQDLKWFERLKQLLLDRTTWLFILYMFIQFILGIVYFVVIVTVFSVSLSLIASPFLQEIMKQTSIMDLNLCCMILLPTWSYPLVTLLGLLILTLFMNIIRGVGQLHGRFAKWMLVSE